MSRPMGRGRTPKNAAPKSSAPPSDKLTLLLTGFARSNRSYRWVTTAHWSARMRRNRTLAEVLALAPKPDDPELLVVLRAACHAYDISRSAANRASRLAAFRAIERQYAGRP